MPFKIVRNDLTKMNTEAIVNTANEHPIVGPGCDRAVYTAAGYEKLLAYRKEHIGRVKEGDVFITPGFGLPAKYIIHAVSPLYLDGEHDEEELLRSCYRKSLALAAEHGIRSIAFPLISTGSFGYPKEEGMRIAVDEIHAFLLHSHMEIWLVVFDEKATRMGRNLYPDLEAYIDLNYVQEQKAVEYGTSYGSSFSGEEADEVLFSAQDKYGEERLPSARSKYREERQSFAQSGYHEDQLPSAREKYSEESPFARERYREERLHREFSERQESAPSSYRSAAAPPPAGGMPPGAAGKSSATGGRPPETVNGQPTVAGKPAAAAGRPSASDERSEEKKSEKKSFLQSLFHRPKPEETEEIAEETENNIEESGFFGAEEAAPYEYASSYNRKESFAPSSAAGSYGGREDFSPEASAGSYGSRDDFDFKVTSGLSDKIADFSDEAAIEEMERKLAERMAHMSDTFPQYLFFLIDQKGLENTDVYKRAIVDKKVFSKIKNNPDYHPQKLTALCLCIGAKLNLDESKDLLARAGYALSPCDKTDIIFSYFIEHGIYDMIELDIQLEEHGLPCIIS